jgi:ParG
MPEKPPAAGQPGPAAAKDPAQLLVKAIGALPEADRDRVYTWLLHRGFQTREAGVVAIPGRSRRMATLLEQDLQPVSGAPLTQASAQQMVPVRFSSEQHAQLRQWCSDHGFSMATVIRGLVSRFLEGQLPEGDKPA